MHTTRSAATAGLVAPKNDKAPWQGCFIEHQSKVNDGNFDTKTMATAIAIAAFLGIECHAVGPDIWMLRHARGGDIGVVHGVSALVAAVGGFEAANNDVRRLVQRMRGGNHG